MDNRFATKLTWGKKITREQEKLKKKCLRNP